MNTIISLLPGSEFQISITAENFLSAEVNASIYINFDGFLKKHSYVSRFKIPNTIDKNLKIIKPKKFLIDNEINLENSLQSMGGITLYINKKLNGSRNLPLIGMVKQNEEHHNGLGIRIILSKQIFRVVFRPEKYDVVA